MVWLTDLASHYFVRFILFVQIAQEVNRKYSSRHKQYRHTIAWAKLHGNPQEMQKTAHHVHIPRDCASWLNNLRVLGNKIRKNGATSLKEAHWLWLQLQTRTRTRKTTVTRESCEVQAIKGRCCFVGRLLPSRLSPRKRLHLKQSSKQHWEEMLCKQILRKQAGTIQAA